MINKLTDFILGNFDTKHKLIKAIKADNYKNWDRHFHEYNTNSEKKAIPREMHSLGLEIYKHNLRDSLSNLRITEEKKLFLNSIIAYFELDNGEVNKIKRKIGFKAVDLLSKYRLQDNCLSKAEEYELQLLAAELSLTPTEAVEIHKKNVIDLYQKNIKSKIDSGKISDSEISDLQKLASAVGLDHKSMPIGQNLKERYEYLVLLNQLAKGYLPTIPATSIVLQKNETVHLQNTAILLTTKTVTTGYRGGSSGVSIRVMKGVSYRLGSSRSTPIREQVTIKNNGVLTITSKRIVFTGNNKSFSIGFNQLLSFDPYNNGIGLNKNNSSSFLLELPNFQTAEITFKILENAINNFYSY